MHPNLSSAHHVTAHRRYAVGFQSIEPGLPCRLFSNEHGAKSAQHTRPPPRLWSMRILECDKRYAPAPAVEEWLGIGEIRISEMERANRRKSASFEGVVKEHAD